MLCAVRQERGTKPIKNTVVCRVVNLLRIPNRRGIRKEREKAIERAPSLVGQWYRLDTAPLT